MSSAAVASRVPPAPPLVRAVPAPTRTGSLRLPSSATNAQIDRQVQALSPQDLAKVEQMVRREGYCERAKGIAMGVLTGIVSIMWLVLAAAVTKIAVVLFSALLVAVMPALWPLAIALGVAGGLALGFAVGSATFFCGPEALFDATAKHMLKADAISNAADALRARMPQLRA